MIVSFIRELFTIVSSFLYKKTLFLAMRNIVNVFEVVPGIQQEWKKNLKYILQSFALFLFFAYYSLPLIIMILLCNRFTNLAVLQIIYGPYLINVFYIVQVFISVCTLFDLKNVFPYYQPLRGLTLYR